MTGANWPAEQIIFLSDQSLEVNMKRIIPLFGIGPIIQFQFLSIRRRFATLRFLQFEPPKNTRQSCFWVVSWDFWLISGAVLLFTQSKAVFMNFICYDNERCFLTRWKKGWDDMDGEDESCINIKKLVENKREATSFLHTLIIYGFKKDERLVSLFYSINMQF